jgi:hypothetical protein
VSAILTSPVTGTLDGYTYSSWAYYAADTSQQNGIDVFYSTSTETANGFSYSPTIGNAINVTGTWSPFDGIPEIDNSSTHTKITVTQISAGNPQYWSGEQFVTLGGGYGSGYAATTTIPTVNVAPNATTTLNSAGEGELVTIDDVTIGATGNFPTHGNLTTTITDESDNSMTMFFWASSYAPDGAMGGAPIPQGLVNVTGFVDSFSSGDEFVPLAITVVPEPSSLGLLGLVGSILAWFAYRRPRRTA